MLHIPLLRHGKPYRSLDVAVVPHHRTRESFVEISQANLGLIRRDLMATENAWQILQRFTVEELLAVCTRAAEHFVNDALPLGDSTQTPEDYVRQVSATTGLPYVLARRNMQKIRAMFAQMREVLAGLTRNLDFSILDTGHGEVAGHAVSFYPRTRSLGVVLPSNSPGVHSLWIPAIPMKIPLVLKPGSAEPWTPYRIVQALVRAGCPPEVFCYYPTGHESGGEILRRCGRSILFGDTSSTRPWMQDARVEIHGPGYSKVVLGPDASECWEEYIDLMAESILSNGGRSCVNASAVWVTAHGDEIAEALAARLAKVAPRPADDEQAQIAPFADAEVPRRISEMIDGAMEEPGARDVTAAHRSGPRLVKFEGCAYVLPTVIRCGREHGLANREFLFPFASVIEVLAGEMPEAFGHTLVVSAVTEDRALIQRLVSSPLIGRLNLGPIPTPQIRWDQPHEGNLFDHLYARRAFQTALAATR